MITRTKWIAGVLTLVLATASGDLALGKTGYSVKVSVPTTSVREGQTVVITVHGDAIDHALMDLYTARPACLPSWKAEANLGKDGTAQLRLGGDRVRGAFSRRFDLRAFGIGTHHACAYLYSRDLHTLAHAAVTWLVRSPA